MNILVVSGSHRPSSNSEKIGKFAQESLQQQQPTHHVDLLSLKENPLPLWEEDFSITIEEAWHPIKSQFKKAHGFVIISPEWNGTVPAGLKNLFLYLSHQETGHKPALIVTVSSGKGGSYPVAELRMSSYKNCRICYIPEHVIIRQADDMFNGPTPSSKEDEYLRNRLNHSLELLTHYTSHFKKLREELPFNFKEFSSGM